VFPLLRGARGVFYIGIACESQEKVISTIERLSKKSGKWSFELTVLGCYYAFAASDGCFFVIIGRL